MTEVDFSRKHNVMIENWDGTYTPMDYPYFEIKKIMPETWQIMGEGDYIYLLEGAEEGICIDTGYGSGNLRKICEALIGKPVKRAINTHDHMDHTGNNYQFDLVYMTQETKSHIEIWPSFNGIDIPTNYPVEIIREGDIIPLKGRELYVIEVPDHASGSIALLDRKQKILFAGDEICSGTKMMNGTIENWQRLLKNVEQFRGEFDLICTGSGLCGADILDDHLACTEKILNGERGTRWYQDDKHSFCEVKDGMTIYRRHVPRPGDGGKKPEFSRPVDADKMYTMSVGSVTLCYCEDAVWDQTNDM